MKTRPQNSHVVKLERCAKLTNLSDLRRADRGGQRDGATAKQQQPSGHRPEGFCCSIMVRHDACHYCEVAERSARRVLYARTAVVDGSSEHRLSTAVQGDIPSTMHELAMSIAAPHRYACAASVQTRGSCSIKRQSVATAHRRVRPWCQEARRALSCDDNDRYRSTLATSCSC